MKYADQSTCHHHAPIVFGRCSRCGKTFKRASLLITLSMLTACGIPEPDASRTIQVLGEPGPSYYVHDIRLKDGTRCAVSTSDNSQGGTGIACDWKSAGSVER